MSKSTHGGMHFNHKHNTKILNVTLTCRPITRSPSAPAARVDPWDIVDATHDRRAAEGPSSSIRFAAGRRPRYHPPWTPQRCCAERGRYSVIQSVPLGHHFVPDEYTSERCLTRCDSPVGSSPARMEVSMMQALDDATQHQCRLQNGAICGRYGAQRRCS